MATKDTTEEKVEKTEKVSRKTVQITTAVTTTGQVLLFALGDDGSIHMIRPTAEESEWSKVKKL